MVMDTTQQQTARSTLKRGAFRFVRDESGTMTIFSVYILLMMLLVGGIGVDLMRNEMERTRVQAVIDRAVLAAADLDQTLDPEAVVNDYFAKAGMSNYLTSVDVKQGLNFRTVTVNADTSTPTQFMRLMGVDSLSVPARSQAEERITNVEISLVLDISGSMSDNNKMPNLRNAANTFVDTLLREETEDLISISVVPYTAHVNASFPIFSNLNVERQHAFSWCVEFLDSEFSTTTFDLTRTYEHMQHFEEQGFNTFTGGPAIENPGCPQQFAENITAFSQDGDTLKNRINQLEPRSNTSIHLGMKWGVSLLDPSFQPITQNLATIDRADEAFASRPASYSDPETLKTVVLMTDGINVVTHRLTPEAYSTRSLRSHWARFPLEWYLRNFVPRQRWDEFRTVKYTPADGDRLLGNICDAAKAQGIVVWSVGFEVTDRSADVMRDCASSPSHFFRVEGVEISEAFTAIASQINQLRLTQ